jgi:hypothetical protein
MAASLLTIFCGQARSGRSDGGLSWPIFATRADLPAKVRLLWKERSINECLSISHEVLLQLYAGWRSCR